MNKIKMNRRRSAFTLLETLVAAFVVVTVAGASLAANRVAQNNASLTADRAQMNALADQTLGLVQTVRDNLESKAATTPVDFGSAFGMPSARSTDIVQRPVLFFITKPAGAPYAYAQNNGPMVIGWCYIYPLASLQCPGGISSPVNSTNPIAVINTPQLPSCNNKPTCTVGQIWQDTKGGDLVALRRTAFQSGLGCGQEVVDLLHPIQPAPWAVCVDTGNTSNYDFYIRNITITRPEGPASAPTCGSFYLDCNLFHSDVGSTSVNNTILGNHWYIVTVKITNLHNLTSLVSKTMLLSDANLSQQKYP